MLIPNKFNGYRKDGTRNLYIGGGVGEAALLEAMMTGAAVGGGTSLVQGKDPLQGALLGGLMGGAASGISGLMPGAAEATTTAANTAPAATTAAATPAATVTPGFESFTPTATQYGAFGEAPLGQSFDSFGSPVPAGSPAATMADPTGLAQQQMSVNASQAPANKGIMSGAKEWFGNLTPKQQLLAGGAGIAGLGMISDQLRGGIPKKKPYTGALSQYRFDPSAYRPYSFASGGDTGGIASLGGYSDGGRMLKGPGDGMSDSIPASIGNKQPARLADGEFVVPADVVSHLGNGSTDAGAKQLYSMMNKVRKARTGNPKQGKQINARKYLPA
jgi:hypothetical protein